MDNALLKKWTILIYADGNNEMEKVIYNSLLSCEKVGSSDEINVVIQIGRLGNYKTVGIKDWSGVRRYYVKNNNSTLVEDLGKINLADPNVLYDFIEWGIKNYSAEHYMLILSDHGGDFIGCFTDLSLDVPYIMGIPEMIMAINGIRKNLGYIIDILLLDMCYMNSVEVLYELGQEENSATKIALTYMSYAPYEGINYIDLISTIQTYNNLSDMNLFIKSLIDNQEFSLAAYEINHKKLEQIKLLFNNIAQTIENPLDKIKLITTNSTESSFIQNINQKLKTILIYSKKTFKGINISINVTINDVGNLIYFYSKLAFSKNNAWKKLLNKKPTNIGKVQKNKINVSLSISSEPQIHYILKFNR